MCYSLERKKESLLLTFVGDIRLEDRDTALAELETQFTDTGLCNLLFDLSLSRPAGKIKMHDALSHARRLTDLQARRKDVRIAYVFHDRQPPVLELIAASRGYMFERFESRTEALEWLQGPPKHAISGTDVDNAPEPAVASQVIAIAAPRSYA